MIALSERRAVGRVYEDVKDRILTGHLRLRERLDVDELARLHGVSTTPVRQALTFLAYERLITPHPTRGHYHVTLWSEQGLRDLYEWRGMLACLAVEDFDASAAKIDVDTYTAYADRIAFVLQALNARTGNELARAALNADERLRAARLVEPDVIENSQAELDALHKAIQDGSRGAIQNVLQAFHTVRVEQASAIRGRAVLRALPEDDLCADQ